jgi:tetratricopeptide (TPR) repeat protein
LIQAQEAARIYEQLAKARPDAFLPNLAMSLNTLANRLSDLGRREEALIQAQEAARIYEQLAKARPDAFEPDWAMSESVKRDCLKAMGDNHGAAAASLQSLQILAPHFLRRPAAHARLMASLLRDYLEDTQAIGQEPDRKLLGPIQEQLEKLNRKTGG